VAGYQPLMPGFQGQLTEEQILSLTHQVAQSQRCLRLVQACRPRGRNKP
jgi:hypothetical protein